MNLGKKKESDDTTSVAATLSEDDLRWLKDIEGALSKDKWEEAELLLLTTQVRTADVSSRLLRERDSLLEAYRLQLKGLPERDRLELIMKLRRMTFGYVTDPYIRSLLAGLRRFLNASIDILVKLAAAFLIAALAGVAHHIVAAHIDRAFDTWLRQYIALVVFILAYRVIEKPLERALEKEVAVIRRWGLRREVKGAYFDGITVQQQEAELAGLRASLTSELRKNQQ